MDFWEFVVTIVFLSVGGGVLRSWIQHRTRLAELRLSIPAKVDEGLRAELDELRREVRQLKDTTLQYDLSFDTTLQRVERRVESLELRQIASSDTRNIQEQRLGN